MCVAKGEQRERTRKKKLKNEERKEIFKLSCESVCVCVCVWRCACVCVCKSVACSICSVACRQFACGMCRVTCLVYTWPTPSSPPPLLLSPASFSCWLCGLARVWLTRNQACPKRANAHCCPSASQSQSQSTLSFASFAGVALNKIMLYALRRIMPASVCVCECA